MLSLFYVCARSCKSFVCFAGEMHKALCELVNHGLTTCSHLVILGAAASADGRFQREFGFTEPFLYGLPCHHHHHHIGHCNWTLQLHVWEINGVRDHILFGKKVKKKTNSTIESLGLFFCQPAAADGLAIHCSSKGKLKKWTNVVVSKKVHWRSGAIYMCWQNCYPDRLLLHKPHNY